jgi:TatA/E family protein of Tat protein translocase
VTVRGAAANGMLGYQEIIIILVIALLVFGPQKLPEIGRQVGNAMREMRKMSSDVQRALDLDEHLSGSSHGRYDDYHSGGSGSFSYGAPAHGETYAATDPYGPAADPAQIESVSATEDEGGAPYDDAHHRFMYDPAAEEEHLSGRPDPLHSGDGVSEPVTTASATAAAASAEVGKES